METKEITLEGKNTDELIETALKQIGKEKDQVKIEVTEAEKSFLGKVKKYSVKITYEELKEEKIMNSPSFFIDYLQDGVYMTLAASDEKLCLSAVFELINKYNLKDISFSDVKEGFTVYNSVPFKIAPAQEKEKREHSFLAYSSEDKMKLFFILLDNNEKCPNDIFDEIQPCFKAYIDKSEIERAVEKKLYNSPILIAKGTAPIDGVDGCVEYSFNAERTLSPKVIENGNIDFKELNLLNNVKKNSVIAKLIPPKNGKSGENIFGEAVDFKEGKEGRFFYGKNIEETADGSALISKINGQVKLENGKLNIYEIYEVRGNVDNSVGNIDFAGSVKVMGNVLSGFSIKCEGDIEVEGVVESSKLESEGDIVIKRGILGNDKCEVKAKGSVFSKYIENAYVFSEKSIEAEMILHSSIVSRGTVSASGKKGAIMGGRIRAKTEVSAKSIGAVMATPTLIEIGVDPHIKRENELLRTGIESVENDIYKLEKVIKLLKDGYDAGMLDSKKRNMYDSAVKTRAELLKKLKEMEYMVDISNYDKEIIGGKVCFQETIYPGVKVIMGKSTYSVDSEISRGTIYRNHINGEIDLGPFIEK